MTKWDNKNISEHDFITLVKPKKLHNFVENTMHMHMGTTIEIKIYEFVYFVTPYPSFLKNDRKYRFALPQIGIIPDENCTNKHPIIVFSLFLSYFVLVVNSCSDILWYLYESKFDRIKKLFD